KIVLLSFLCLCALGTLNGCSRSQAPGAFADATIKNTRDTQAAQTAEIIVGPFDLSRRYRSMEGPYCHEEVTIGDLLNNKKDIVPDSRIFFVGTGAEPPSCMGQSPPGHSKGGAPTAAKRELYWFKGIKLDVLDENDKPLKDAEFICHMNIDVDKNFRNA